MSPAAPNAFPSSRNFVVQVESELIQVGQPGGSVWRNLTRGFNGTQPAAHAQNAVVTLMGVTVVVVDPSLVTQVATVAVTSAQLKAMRATPVTIVAAPGAGKAIVDVRIHLQFKNGTTQYTLGGPVTFPYHGTAVLAHDAADAVAAATINAAAASNNMLAPISAGIKVPTGLGIDMTAGVAEFATGNGTAIVTVWYRVVTLG